MSAVVVPARPFALSSGAVETLKWIALVAMVVDHANVVFYARELGTWATIIGRLPFPLFAIVFGYNLARPGVLWPALDRLALFGVASIPVHALLFSQSGGWWPLNILLTFALSAAIICAIESRRYWLAFSLFVVGGALVEYWWPGVLLVLASHYVARNGCNAHKLAGLTLAAAGLFFVNGNAWALLAAPVVAVVALWAPAVPRSGRFFLWFYPVHLVALALLSVPMG